MQPGIGQLDVFPSIWGRKSLSASQSASYLLTDSMADWAGGPGDSKEDVEWLDKKMAKFFSEN